MFILIQLLKALPTVIMVLKELNALKGKRDVQVQQKES